jgi:hypothetical protein
MVVFITKSLKRKMIIYHFPCDKIRLTLSAAGVHFLRAPPIADCGTVSQPSPGPDCVLDGIPIIFNNFFINTL